MSKQLSEVAKILFLESLVLKSQWQIWDVLQGVSYLGVSFTREICAWYDSSFQVRIRILSREVGYSHRLITLGKRFSLVKF